MLILVLENAHGRNRYFKPSSLDQNYRFCIFMQKCQRFCIFIHFCYFTSFNITFVNILTIVSKSASFTYTFQSWYLLYAKPWVSGPKTLGFTTWNQGFQTVNRWVSQTALQVPKNCIFMQLLLLVVISAKIYAYTQVDAKCTTISPLKRSFSVPCSTNIMFKMFKDKYVWRLLLRL